jgi:hypothetical protein
VRAGRMRAGRGLTRTGPDALDTNHRTDPGSVSDGEDDTLATRWDYGACGAGWLPKRWADPSAVQSSGSSCCSDCLCSRRARRWVSFGKMEPLCYGSRLVLRMLGMVYICFGYDCVNSSSETH